MKIKVRLSDAGLRDAERQIQEYKTTLNKKARAFAFRLSWLGLEVAKVRFANAEYAGSNDVKCHINQKNKTCTIGCRRQSGRLYRVWHWRTSQRIWRRTTARCWRAWLLRQRARRKPQMVLLRRIRQCWHACQTGGW